MALRAFLIILKLPQYEDFLLGAGFGDVAAYATFSDDDVETMEKTLLTAGMLPGHASRIMVMVRKYQDTAQQHKNGSPLKFDYGKQMPLLEILRGQVRALQEEVREWRGKAKERELVMLEEHGKWKESSELDKDALRTKKVFFRIERVSISNACAI